MFNPICLWCAIQDNCPFKSYAQCLAYRNDIANNQLEPEKDDCHIESSDKVKPITTGEELPGYYFKFFNHYPNGLTAINTELARLFTGGFNSPIDAYAQLAPLLLLEEMHHAECYIGHGKKL